MINIDYIAGLIDSDGNVDLSFRKRKDGYAPFLKITIVQKNVFVLNKIKKYLGYGYIYSTKSKCFVYEINSVKAFSLAKELSEKCLLNNIKLMFSKQYSTTDRFSLDEIGSIRKRFLSLEENTEFSNFNYSWLAGFIDGDGCLGCYKNSSTKKLRFILSISYDKLYNPFFIYLKNKIEKSRIRDTTDGNKQWILDINSSSISFLEEIIPFLVVKKYQALLSYYWILENPINKRNTKTDKELEKVYQLMHIDKEEFLTPSIFQLISSFTAIYTEKYNIIYPSLGLFSEVGELIGKIKKDIALCKTNSANMDEIKLEISDCLWYISQISNDLGLDLQDIIEKNVEKLFLRFKNNKIKGDGDKR